MPTTWRLFNGHDDQQSQGTRGSLGLAVIIVGLSACSVRAAVDNSAVGWGQNGDGALGNGSLVNSTTPVHVTGLNSGVTSIAVGVFHGVAVQNGAAKAWGSNTYGQLGNGSSARSTVPVSVTGLTNGVTAVAGGSYHCLAIQNGAAMAWGANHAGQLGNGSDLDSRTPVAVAGLDSGVTSIGGGYAHSVAIHNGAVKAWGTNSGGLLGNGSSQRSFTPVPVTGLGSGVTTIAVGYLHNLAIQNGAVKAWGYNVHGQLGIGTSGYETNSNVPVATSVLSSGVTAIAAGSEHSLAIQNGNVFAWGRNASGQLGTASTADRFTPVRVLDLSVNLVAVAATGTASYALSADGSLWVWGSNYYGQLGLGDNIDRARPTQLLPPSGYAYTSIEGDTFATHVIATMTLVPEPATLAFSGLSLLLPRRRHSGQRDTLERTAVT